MGTGQKDEDRKTVTRETDALQPCWKASKAGAVLLESFHADTAPRFWLW